MHVEPYAWLVTLPLTVALIHFHLLPEQHGAKRLWRALGQYDSLAWERLGWTGHALDLNAKPRARRLLFVVVLVGLCISTIASLAAFAGAGSAI